MEDNWRLKRRLEKQEAAELVERECERQIPARAQYTLTAAKRYSW